VHRMRRSRRRRAEQRLRYFGGRSREPSSAIGAETV